MHTIRSWVEDSRQSEAQKVNSVLSCLNLTFCLYSDGGELATMCELCEPHPDAEGCGCCMPTFEIDHQAWEEAKAKYEQVGKQLAYELTGAQQRDAQAAHIQFVLRCDDTGREITATSTPEATVGRVLSAVSASSISLAGCKLPDKTLASQVTASTMCMLGLG